MTKRLSKSRYVSGCQCELKLWYECFHREFSAPVTEALQAIFDTGHEVGRVACERYPGGVLVEADYRHSEAALEQTATLMSDPSIPAIFEAAFLFEDVLVRVDILERSGANEWRLVEVKSTTSAKPAHDLDVAIQYYVLQGAGLNVTQAGVLTLNPEYYHDGVALDRQQLFSFHDRTDVVRSMQAEVVENLAAFQTMLANNDAPDVAPGQHCHAPYDCAYFAHCTRDIQAPEFPISNIPRLGKPKQAELESLGIHQISDIPQDFPLTANQTKVRDCTVNNEVYISPQLGSSLREITYPIYYLDFEACAPAIPRYEGTRPYGATPFQFSVHVQSEQGNVCTPSAQVGQTSLIA